MSLVNAIRRSVRDQDIEMALTSFHKGWDGEIDEDTILQGLMFRYSACGKSNVVREGVRIERHSLDVVVIEAKSSRDLVNGTRRLLTVRRLHRYSERTHLISTGYRTFGDYSISTAHPELWHDEELEEVGKWLMENFHH